MFYCAVTLTPELVLRWLAFVFGLQMTQFFKYYGPALNESTKNNKSKLSFFLRNSGSVVLFNDPPSNSSYSKELDHEIMGHIEKEIEHFQKRGNVLLCGDFNARVG
jgi:hypothetical protein